MPDELPAVTTPDDLRDAHRDEEREWECERCGRPMCPYDVCWLCGDER